jgi:hypothetical protein
VSSQAWRWRPYPPKIPFAGSCHFTYTKDAPSRRGAHLLQELLQVGLDGDGVVQLLRHGVHPQLAGSPDAVLQKKGVAHRVKLGCCVHFLIRFHTPTFSSVCIGELEGLEECLTPKNFEAAKFEGLHNT